MSRAYALYATDDAYALAVLTFTRLLRQRGIGEGIEVVVLHHGVRPRVVSAFEEQGLRPRRVAPLRRAAALSRLRRGPTSYFRHSLTKLRVFELAEYERVVYCDADSVPLRSLDALFEAPGEGPVAAPVAYWLPQPWWTSALMVIRPDPAVWLAVREYAANARRDVHDMDVVNLGLRGRIDSLPAGAFALNSEWERDPAPTYGHGAELPERGRLRSGAFVVHMSALGKPWTHTTAECRRLRPEANPYFCGLWREWRATHAEVIRDLGRPPIEV